MLGEEEMEGHSGNQKTVVKAHAEKYLWLYALCGAIAPIFFGLMLIGEQFVVPGYSWTSQFVSDLGAFSLYGSYAILQTLNFWVFGTLVFIFALGLRSIPFGSKVLVRTLALFGSMAFSAGVFSDQPYPFPGNAHLLVSGVAFISIVLCQFSAWIRLRRSPTGTGEGWSLYGKYSLASGILSALLLSQITAYGTQFQGILERLAMTVPWLWIEVIALRVLRSSRIPN